MKKNITNEIIELENGWIQTPHGTFTPNDRLGQTVWEVYENHLKDLENPKPPKPSLEEVVNQQAIKIVALQESQTAQDMDIMFTQEAVDFLMLGSMATKLNNNIKLGGSNMAGYIATRIIKKGNISVEAGRDYYVTFLTHSDYAQYKTEVDLILRAECRENLIVDLTNM